jgi:phosphopantetheinyl transferase (holo-ACP synthase)
MTVWGTRMRGSNYDGAAMHGNLELWLGAPEGAQHFDPAEIADLERDRLARLRRPERRREFAVSRALRAHVRRGTTQPVFESLSHSGGYAALACSDREVRIGVDMEQHRPRDSLAMARTAFAESEVRALEATAGAERDQLFHAMWTVKEALAKALQLPLFEALRCCEVAVGASAWQVRMPHSAAGIVRVYQPRVNFTLAVACIDATPSISSWSWPPQRMESWPLIAAISLAAACAPAATGRESAGAARAAAPASDSGTDGNSCESAPARPPAAP